MLRNVCNARVLSLITAVALFTATAQAQQAPGLSGMPLEGQCSSAAKSASCVSSSASGTSRSILERLVMSRGCSTRQTARIARWTSAVVAADSI